MIDDRNATFQCLKLIVYRELKMDEISPRLGQLFLHHFPSTHTLLSDRKVLEYLVVCQTQAWDNICTGRG